jgi:chromosome segregation ATPase
MCFVVPFVMQNKDVVRVHKLLEQLDHQTRKADACAMELLKAKNKIDVMNTAFETLSARLHKAVAAAREAKKTLDTQEETLRTQGKTLHTQEKELEVLRRRVRALQHELASQAAPRPMPGGWCVQPGRPSLYDVMSVCEQINNRFAILQHST